MSGGRPTSLLLPGMSLQGDGNRATIAARMALRAESNALKSPKLKRRRGGSWNYGHDGGAHLLRLCRHHSRAAGRLFVPARARRLAGAAGLD